MLRRRRTRKNKSLFAEPKKKNKDEATILSTCPDSMPTSGEDSCIGVDETLVCEYGQDCCFPSDGAACQCFPSTECSCFVGDDGPVWVCDQSVLLQNCVETLGCTP